MNMQSETLSCLISQNETVAVPCLICLILPSRTRPDLSNTPVLTNLQKSLILIESYGFQTLVALQ